jgi:hypothetical protein
MTKGTLIVVALSLYGIGMIVLVEYASWTASGWRQLQTRFRSPFLPQGDRFRSISGTMGRGLFKKSINFGCNNEGVFFWQSRFFDGLFHRKLFVPWNSILGLEIEGEIVKFYINSVPVRLFSKKVAQWILMNLRDKLDGILEPESKSGSGKSDAEKEQ